MGNGCDLAAETPIKLRQYREAAQVGTHCCVCSSRRASLLGTSRVIDGGQF